MKHRGQLPDGSLRSSADEDISNPVSQRKGILRNLNPVGGWGAVVGTALAASLGLATLTYAIGFDIGGSRTEQAEALREAAENRANEAEARTVEAERKLDEALRKVGKPEPSPASPADSNAVSNTGASEVYLANMEPVSGYIDIGPQTIDIKSYKQSIARELKAFVVKR